jgi:hypothetical protein
MTDVPGETFELSDLSRILWVKWMRGKWARGVSFILLVGGFAVLFAVSAVNASVHGAFASYGVADIVLVALFVTLGLIGYWANIRWQYPSIGLIVGREGLVVRYKSGNPLIKRWEDPSFKIRIERRYSNALNATVSSSTFTWRPRVFMTGEIVDALVGTARAHGMEVLSVKDPNSTSGESTLIRAPRSKAVVS